MKDELFFIGIMLYFVGEGLVRFGYPESHIVVTVMYGLAVIVLLYDILKRVIKRNEH